MQTKKIGLMGAGILFCLVAGAGFEHARLWFTTAPPEAPVPVESAPRPVRDEAQPKTVVVRDEASARAAAALRQRVLELEQALAARDAELEKARQAKAVEPEAPAGGNRPSFADRMEQFKKEQPEQYAEMVKRRDEFRQRMEQDQKDRVAFLSAMDTQGMSAEQKATHTKLLQTLAAMDTLWAQRTQSSAEPGSEADTALRQAMGQTMADLGMLAGQERDILLQQAASAAGYKGEDATKFVQYIQKTIQSTSMFGGPGGPRGGGPPPGGM